MKAAIIHLTAAGKVLLLKRAPTANNEPNVWGFPGGHIESGETPSQAAVRELYEETGYRATGLAEEAARLKDLSTFDRSTDIVIFSADVPTFTPVLNDEHTEYVWADPSALPEPLHPGTEGIVAHFNQSRRQLDINGWPEIRDNPISKAGVFQYSGRSIGDPALDPNRLYSVYRPAEELNNPETLASFRLLPFTNDHPTDMLGVDDDAPKIDGKPMEGVIGERVWFDEATGMLRANLKLFTERINRAIEAGKRDVSAGFRCIYEKAAGVYNGQPYEYIQRNIRGNHASLVTEGRAGPDVAVLDHFKLTFDAKEAMTMADPVKDANGEGGQEMTLAEITATIKAIGPQIAALTEAMAALSGKPEAEAIVEDADGEQPAAIDAEGEEPAALDKCTMDAIEKAVSRAMSKAAKPTKALDSKDVIRTLEQRDALYQGVSKQVGAFAHTGMDAQDIAVYAVDKLGLQNVPKGAEVVAVEAYLAAATKQPTAKALDAAPTGTSAIAKHVKGA